MSFYDLSREERIDIVHKIELEVKSDLEHSVNGNIFRYASDDDTYIRKNLYLILSRLYQNEPDFKEKIIESTKLLYSSSNEKHRQTAVYVWGEIGKIDFDAVELFLVTVLNDNSKKVKSAITGSLKRMGDKNPKPTLNFAQKFINHPDPEVRRLIVHGIELRGRTHPEEVLPLLYQLQNEVTPRVKNMVIHVIGQISYKEGCLETVVLDLIGWENKELVKKSLLEIINVHQMYNFAYKSEKEAKSYIKSKFGFNFILDED